MPRRASCIGAPLPQCVSTSHTCTASAEGGDESCPPCAHQGMAPPAASRPHAFAVDLAPTQTLPKQNRHTAEGKFLVGHSWWWEVEVPRRLEEWQSPRTQPPWRAPPASCAASFSGGPAAQGTETGCWQSTSHVNACMNLCKKAILLVVEEAFGPLHRLAGWEGRLR